MKTFTSLVLISIITSSISVFASGLQVPDRSRVQRDMDKKINAGWTCMDSNEGHSANDKGEYAVKMRCIHRSGDIENGATIYVFDNPSSKCRVMTAIRLEGITIPVDEN